MVDVCILKYVKGKRLYHEREKAEGSEAEREAEERQYGQLLPFHQGPDYCPLYAGRAAFRQHRPDRRDIMFQKMTPDYAHEALVQRGEIVRQHLELLDRIPSGDINDVATALTHLSSNGASYMAKAKRDLNEWVSGTSTAVQDMSAVQTLINGIMNSDERAAFFMAYPDSAKARGAVNVLHVMNDYAQWKLTGTVNTENISDMSILNTVFKRMRAVEDNRDAVMSELGRIEQLVGERIDRHVAEDDATFVPDISVFSNLPSYIQRALLDSGWTEEGYNKASEDIQDKTLRCTM